MTLNDAIGLSLRNLRQSKLRTALTTLGVSIGIASLAGMVSLGVGLQDQVVGRFTQSGLFGTITVTTQGDLAGPLMRFEGRGGFRGGQSRTGAKQTSSVKLDDEAIKQIAALQNVREVSPNLRIPAEMTLEDFSQGAVITGVPMSSKGEGAFQTFSYGQFFNNESENACMLSLGVAKLITEASPGNLIGKSLTLSYPAMRNNNVERVDRQCRLVGIVERDPGAVPGGSPLSGVMVPMGMAKEMNAEIVTNAESLLSAAAQPKSYGSITVKVTQPQFTQDVENRLKGMGYSAFSVDDALRGAKNAFIIFDILLSLIGSIALTVSSLGIVNTMVMSILERTREIGVMKAIGASDRDIRRIFLVEASAIGLLGGLVGIALGWVAGRAINFGANLYIQNQGGTPGTLFSLPLWLIAGAIAFSILVSLAAGSYPASRAARLDPIQALRHD